ncbi:Glycine cleavage system transcriptional activator [Vibrio celticus]|uniref:Glycine cleavage system transcriptional activator n=1 Tax=Vibrio celticus TaxID=446372 RepID=A0A1C3J8Q0_9VIBR|nr:Glycine cleavage system transcriptional activator [Vibrio celticus]
MLLPLRAFVAFEAVARLGSIGAAARELCVTQAAVSQQLKSLQAFLACHPSIRNTLYQARYSVGGLAINQPLPECRYRTD